MNLISIVILTKNQLKYLKLCLESIKSWVSLPYEVIIVDKGSTNETISYLKSLDGVKLILNQTNCKLARAINMGIKATSGNYILLLNSGVIVTNNCLDNLLRCMKSSSKIGVVGPRTNSYAAGVQGGVAGDFKNLDKILNFSRSFNQSSPDKWFEVKELFDFCMLIKREVFEANSLFNESLEKSNWVDNDFCFQARKAGYKLYCAGDTFVFRFLKQIKIKKKFLIVGHPRSGTGFMAKLLMSFGYDVRHEAMGYDGISSWMFAVEDYQKWTDNTLNRDDYQFKYVIMNLRNPLDIVSSTFFTEDASLSYRQGHLNMTGLNKYELAVESVIKWYRLIEMQKPDLKIKIDDKPKEKLYYFLKRFENEALILPDRNINKEENSRSHPKLSIDDIKNNCNKKLIREFINFCQLYNYKII